MTQRGGVAHLQRAGMQVLPAYDRNCTLLHAPCFGGVVNGPDRLTAASPAALLSNLKGRTCATQQRFRTGEG